MAPRAPDQDDRSKPRYRRVSTRMHHDKKFRALSPVRPSGQSLWEYLIHGPHTTACPGLAHAGEAGLAEELGWSLREFRRCWKEIEDQEMGYADWDARVIWLPNAVKHNPPENPNVVKAWRKCYDDLIPECALKHRAEQAIRDFLKAYSKAFQKAFGEVFDESLAESDPKASVNGLVNGSPKSSVDDSPKSLGKQDQVQVQIQVQGEHAREPRAPLTLTRGQATAAVQSLIAQWNGQIEPPLKAIPTTLQPASVQRVVRALQTYPDLDWWAARMADVRASDYLMGRVPGSKGTPFTADFWWLLENVDKLVAGRYKNRDVPKETPAVAAERKQEVIRQRSENFLAIARGQA